VLTECVVNISEGRDVDLIREIADQAGTTLLDVHSDPEHHRTVLTLGGEADHLEAAVRSVAESAVQRIDLRAHDGAHPRFGAVDVVPFVPLGPAGRLDAAVEARNRFAAWAGVTLELPCFLYGPERSLPEVRREAFQTLDPDTGPSIPHPTAGATAVGARPLLVAYNIWITVSEGSETDPAAALGLARGIASSIRSPALRSLGLAVGTGAQVSCNLIDPHSVSLAVLFDTVSHLAEEAGGRVERAELVGLVPAELLSSVPSYRWAELDLSQDRTIEARLESVGVAVGW
jgi:glutamate formiminotransferase / 5-formyltetrahydrofolate cyclo-ligase